MKEILLTVLLAVSFSAQAQDAFNGEALLKGCKALLYKPANPQSSAYENYLSGMCTGLIIGNIGHDNIQEDLGNPRLFCLKKGWGTKRRGSYVIYRFDTIKSAVRAFNNRA